MADKEEYKMLSVKQSTKENLKSIKQDIGIEWDRMISDYVDILEEGGVSERGDLAILKKDIMEWLENGRKE